MKTAVQFCQQHTFWLSGTSVAETGKKHCFQKKTVCSVVVSDFFFLCPRTEILIIFFCRRICRKRNVSTLPEYCSHPLRTITMNEQCKLHVKGKVFTKQIEEQHGYKFNFTNERKSHFRSLFELVYPQKHVTPVALFLGENVRVLLHLVRKSYR